VNQKALTINLANVSPQGSLDAYLVAMHQVPLLSVDEEQKLAQEFHKTNDLDAARQLVMAHLRYVASIAKGYRGYGLALSDLIQEGNIGLMKAVKRFDPDLGVRLASFAVHWIRAEMHEYIIKNWRIVKIATTKAQRKLFFNLRKSKKRLGWFSQAQIEQVAQDLNVTPKEVVAMEKRLSDYDTSFDGYADDSDSTSDTTFAPATYLKANNADPAVQLESANWDDARTTQLTTALASLDERSRAILQTRWLNDKKMTLASLAKQYNVSAERIRQIENAALKKLKQHIETA